MHCARSTGRYSTKPSNPEPYLFPSDLQLSFSSVTTIEQLLTFLDLPLPPELVGAAAAQSLGAILPQGDTRSGISIDKLYIKAGADPEHVSVSSHTNAM